MPRLRILLGVAGLVLAIMHSSAAAQAGATRAEEGSYLGPTRQNMFGTRDCLTVGFFTQGVAPMSQGCVYFVVEPRTGSYQRPSMMKQASRPRV